VLHSDNYVGEPWQATLITLAFLALAVCFNTFFASTIPMLEASLVFFHIFGIVVFIPVWALSPKAEGGSPLVDFFNPGGWSSNGLATLIGAAPVITTLIGFDCSVHMCMLSFQLFGFFCLPIYLVAEETKDASLNVPNTLLAGYAVNVLLGFFAMMAW
jgi:Amino acid permease